MMDYTVIEQPQRPTPQNEKNLRTYCIVMYALYAASLVVGVSLLAGVILGYVKRAEAEGTLYHDHIRYLLKTFWVSLIGLLVGGATLALMVGGLILLLVSIWFVYRVVAGFIKLYDGKAVSPDGWW